MLKKWLNWLRAMWQWLLEPALVWGAAAVILSAILFAALLPKSLEDCLRYAGLALQILGVITVAIGLRDKRRTFQRPGMIGLFVCWIKRIPRFSGNVQFITGVGVASMGMVGSAQAYGWHGVPQNPTLEERLLAIEKNVETVRELALTAQRNIQEEAAKLSSKIDQEATARTNADKTLHDKLETFGAGNLHLEAIGVTWLIVGIILGTIPTEVATLWKILT